MLQTRKFLFNLWLLFPQVKRDAKFKFNSVLDPNLNYSLNYSRCNISKNYVAAVLNRPK